MRGKQTLALAGVLLVLLALVACGGGTTEEQVDPNAELWADIETRQGAIGDLRAEVAELAAQMNAEPAEEGEESEAAEGAEGAEEAAEPVATPEELAAKIADLESQIQEKGYDLYTKVAEYINNSGLVEGAERTPEQQRAFDLKADLDIGIAQEYIDKGGDYKKAIDIYSQALMSDETNAKLLAARDLAESLRYMNEERFSGVKKGMTQDEVQGLLGTVKTTNVRDFEEKGRVGWFFPKDPEAGGGAAGVYFKEKGKDSGNWVVDVVDYEAVKAAAPAEADAG